MNYDEVKLRRLIGNVNGLLPRQCLRVLMSTL